MKSKQKNVKNPKFNLSNGQKEAMKYLAKRRDIIITTADKGGAVVIMNTENYIKEANRQLSDKNNYKTLLTDSTLQHNKMVNDTLERFKNENLLSKKTAEGLKIINAKTPKSYQKYTNKIIQGDRSLTQSTVTRRKFYALLTITFKL